MGTLIITEYEDLAKDGMGNVIMAGQEPAVAIQPVTTSASTAASAAFNSKTRFIRIQSDTNEAIIVGASPTAATTDTPINANEREFLGVRPGLKLAAINR